MITWIDTGLWSDRTVCETPCTNRTHQMLRVYHSRSSRFIRHFCARGHPVTPLPLLPPLKSEYLLLRILHSSQLQLNIQWNVAILSQTSKSLRRLFENDLLFNFIRFPEVDFLMFRVLLRGRVLIQLHSGFNHSTQDVNTNTNTVDRLSSANESADFPCYVYCGHNGHHNCDSSHKILARIEIQNAIQNIRKHLCNFLWTFPFKTVEQNWILTF